MQSTNMTINRKLNYQHLLYFWSVVRTGSLTQASKELALSAQAISPQLKMLEERLGEALLKKSGRTLVPTEIGRVVYGYAEQIFDLGRELLEALEGRPAHRPLRFIVGIDDVVPKEIVQRLLEPALQLGQSVRLTCKEGTLDRLVADLAIHESDLVLSDAPITPALNLRVYSHHLGASGVCWMAKATLAKKLRRAFPNLWTESRYCYRPQTRRFGGRSISGQIDTRFIQLWSESSRITHCYGRSLGRGTA